MTYQHTAQAPQGHSAHAAIVVAADAGRARIFSAPPGNSRQLTEVTDFLNPAMRLQDHDALSDRKGHVTHGAAGIGHAFEPRQSHSEHTAEVFAKQVCKFLSDARDAERIYLIADPSFLGVLRKHLDDATRGRIVQEIAADLSRHSTTDIRDALPAVL